MEDVGDALLMDAGRTIRQHVDIPFVLNGDVFSMADVERAAREVGCDGMMAARGLLANPAMFAGFDSAPAECVEDWLRLCGLCGANAEYAGMGAVSFCYDRLTKSGMVRPMHSSSHCCVQTGCC